MPYVPYVPLKPGHPINPYTIRGRVIEYDVQHDQIVGAVPVAFGERTLKPETATANRQPSKRIPPPYNGQIIGTSKIAIPYTSTVSSEPTLTKSRNRYRPGP